MVPITNVEYAGRGRRRLSGTKEYLHCKSLRFLQILHVYIYLPDETYEKHFIVDVIKKTAPVF